MARMRIPAFLTLALAAAATTAALGTRPVAAECWMTRLDFTPVDGLQIAVWIEDKGGQFVDTVYVTRTTGSFGLGNRPGRQDFNSEFLWPYGRRENVLPVWAHRRGVRYPRLVFQDGDENDLSHGISASSREAHYCRPLRTGEAIWSESIDQGSCATGAFTDKGVFSPLQYSYYPPRNDLGALGQGDAFDMLEFRTMNDLDAVSRATPRGFAAHTLYYALPPELPEGDYVVWVEVSREHDFNDIYNPDSYPSPIGIPWDSYGLPWRGQPSVVYRLPLRIGTSGLQASTTDYAGYGDPDGQDGELRPPDDTIDTQAGRYTVPASLTMPERTVDTFGAARLQLEPAPGGAYRLRLQVDRIPDDTAPAEPGHALVTPVFATTAHLVFAAPGDDGLDGRALRYEIRLRAGAPLDAGNFVTEGTLVETDLAPAEPGVHHAVRLADLLPETHYWVGIRAIDDCLNAGAPRIVSFVTPPLLPGEVDACFVATAAWGSSLSAHVQTLRKVRDSVLRRQILGELFVEAYYTFGPAFAEIIEPSADLRRLARSGLSPLVDFGQALVENPHLQGKEGPASP